MGSLCGPLLLSNTDFHVLQRGFSTRGLAAQSGLWTTAPRWHGQTLGTDQDVSITVHVTREFSTTAKNDRTDAKVKQRMRQTAKPVDILLESKEAKAIFICNITESSETKGFTNKAFHRDLTLVLVSIYILRMRLQQFA